VSSLRYRRVVVKLSGRAFAGAADFGLDSESLGYVADQLIAARAMGVEEAVVVGGGNFFRGNVADEWEIERAEADNIGMLGTVMNGILLRGVLKHRGLEDVRLMTALPMTSMAEPYIRRRAIRHLEKGRVVILAGLLVSYPYWWEQAAALTNELTHIILSPAPVLAGIHKLMVYATEGVVPEPFLPHDMDAGWKIKGR